MLALLLAGSRFTARSRYDTFAQSAAYTTSTRINDVFASRVPDGHQKVVSRKACSSVCRQNAPDKRVHAGVPPRRAAAYTVK